MNFITNTSRLKNVRQKLRNDMPEPEKKLWYYLRNKQLGVKFRRQFSVGNYVLDFYCHEKQLAIEVDGDSHFESRKAVEYDKVRTTFLKQQQIRTIRFTNDEILTDVETCVNVILQVLESTPPSLPCRGEETTQLT